LCTVSVLSCTRSLGGRADHLSIFGTARSWNCALFVTAQQRMCVFLLFVSMCIMAIYIIVEPDPETCRNWLILYIRVCKNIQASNVCNRALQISPTESAPATQGCGRLQHTSTSIKFRVERIGGPCGRAESVLSGGLLVSIERRRRRRRRTDVGTDVSSLPTQPEPWPRYQLPVRPSVRPSQCRHGNRRRNWHQANGPGS